MSGGPPSSFLVEDCNLIGDSGFRMDLKLKRVFVGYDSSNALGIPTVRDVSFYYDGPSGPWVCIFDANPPSYTVFREHVVPNNNPQVVKRVTVYRHAIYPVITGLTMFF